VRDSGGGSRRIQGLYTETMLEALQGEAAGVLEPLPSSPSDGAQYVWPGKLRDFLEREIPLRVRKMNLQNTVNQSPDAIILDHPNWMARIERPLTRRTQEQHGVSFIETGTPGTLGG